MGQQQLLLLVLGIVIVGIAVVAGIQAFSEGKSKSERDAAASDAMRIVSDAQAWRLKPDAFGGGAKAMQPPTFQDLGYPTAVDDGTGAFGSGVQPEGNYKTVSGCYDIAAASNGTDGVAEITIQLLNTDGTCGADYATVDITGTTSDDIDWEYNTGAS
jgi:type II secretory pathway pseudopilin PulG